MNKRELFATSVAPPDAAAFRAAKTRWDRASKPLDGLGEFETTICRLAAVERVAIPEICPRAAAIMCGDNGVVAEGVSQCGSEATYAVAVALGRGLSSASVLARSANVRVVPIDVGIARRGAIPGVVDAKVAPGTRDFLREPAMTEEETLAAISVGIAAAERLTREGIRVVAAGEMGIGNTTTATAILCATLGVDVDATTGRGAGLDDAGLARKKRAIRAGLEKYAFGSVRRESRDEKERAFEILRTFGGLEIAALVGLTLGAATRGTPTILDGLVTSVAALLAETFAPGTREYLFASHAGREKGNRVALAKLGLTPAILGDMALGEGTGAIMLFPLLDMVLDFYKNASTFAEIRLKEYERFGK